jgi:hypothetical protein
MVERVRQAVELEIAYATDVLPRVILGLNSGLFRDYVQFIADRRLERIGPGDAVRIIQSLPLDERDDRSFQGKELLRDPRHRVPDIGNAGLGLTDAAQTKRWLAREASHERIKIS